MPWRHRYRRSLRPVGIVPRTPTRQSPSSTATGTRDAQTRRLTITNPVSLPPIIPQRASLTSLRGLQSTIQIHRRLDQLIHNRFLPLLTQRRHLGFHTFLLRRSSGCDRFSDRLQPSLTLVVGSGQLVGKERRNFFNLCRADVSASRHAHRPLGLTFSAKDNAGKTATESAIFCRGFPG
jgi:hypothetical protein